MKALFRRLKDLRERSSQHQRPSSSPSMLSTRGGIVFLATAPFFILMATEGFSARSIESVTSGPNYIAQVFTPCSGSADLYPSTNGRFAGSVPDFSAVTLSPVVIDGVNTWDLLVLGPSGSACRPSKKFRLVTASTDPVGDYCMVTGGCDAGQAAVFTP